MEGMGTVPTGPRSQFARRLVAAITCVAVLGGTALTASSVAQDPPAEDPLGDLPLNPEWLSNTLERASTTASVKNNTVPGAIERRDQAIADWKAAQAKAKGYKPKAKQSQASGQARPPVRPSRPRARSGARRSPNGRRS